MLKPILGLTLAISAFAEGPTFDVASIKPSTPPMGGMIRMGPQGGPGTDDPGLFKCTNCPVSFLIAQAWDLQPYQVLGPSAAFANQFDITAKVPAGTSKDQFRIMLRNMLAERFKMVSHIDKKEMAAFDLVIAKNGPKLKEAAPLDPDAPKDLPPPPPGGLGRMKMGADGFPDLPKVPGRPLTIRMNGRARTLATSVGMDELATFLTNQVGGKPVVDATGLKGKYDFTLTYAPDMPVGVMAPPHPDGPAVSENTEPLPNIFAALQEQLGLKLEPKKSTVDMIIVDHIEKTPSEN